MTFIILPEIAAELMQDHKVLGFSGSMMQSFTSIGPMLDLVALFTVIAVYSGILLPLVMGLSFIVGYSTMNTVFRFSSIYSSNGGYYSYVGKALGKTPALFVGFLYLMYAALVLPNISLFISSFVATSLSLVYTIPSYLVLIISLVFPLFIIVFVFTGLKLTMKYTVVAGLIEFSMIILASFLFFTHSVAGFGVYNGLNVNVNSVFLGLVFGILVFSGSGSSIFLSDNVRNSTRTVPWSIISSYSVSGILMVVSSFALVFFLGTSGISSYTINPFVLLTQIYNRLGLPFFLAFVALSVLSSANLTISYTNALRNSFRKMLSEKFFSLIPPKESSQNYLLLLTMGLSMILGMIAYSWNNYVTLFEVIAGAVSLSYMTIHIITNIALLKLHKRVSLVYVLPSVIISTALLSIAMYYSLFLPDHSLFYSNVLFGSIIAIALVSTAMIRSKKDRYESIRIEVEEVGNATSHPT